VLQLLHDRHHFHSKPLSTCKETCEVSRLPCSGDEDCWHIDNRECKYRNFDVQMWSNAAPTLGKLQELCSGDVRF
jgi:hypothetical protein